MKQPVNILVIDDEKTLCETLSEVLREEGYQTDVAYDGQQAIGLIEKKSYDVIFCDLRMPTLDGLSVLEKTMSCLPHVFFIVMTAYGSLDTTLKALKLGAHDYVLKPLVFDDVLLKLKHLLAYKELRIENRILKDSTVAEEFDLDNVLGQGTEMKDIYSLVQKVAPTSNTILITGEVGVGKEKLAKAIHYQSVQRDKSFMVVRCGSYPENQLDETLFGQEGIFSRSTEGTVLIDDIAELSLVLQHKLLEALTDHSPQKKGIRIIVSSTKDLNKEVEKGVFREDLLYRVNVIEIKVLPLRARMNDIPFLVKYYVRTHSEELGKKVRFVTDRAREVLVNYPWKGNIRELKNVLERAILLCEPNTQYIDVCDLPSEMTSLAIHSLNQNFKETMRQHEYKHIQRVLEKNRFDKKKTAQELGLSLSSLYRKIEELSMPIQ